LSLELGSFLAGVMISTTDFAHHTLEQVLFCILESTVPFLSSPFISF
jgi:Kef-type K+ transport system membrane component KefB